MLDILELELQTVGSHHVGAGNRTWFSAEQQVLLTAEHSKPILVYSLEKGLWYPRLCVYVHCVGVCVCVCVCVCMCVCVGEFSLSSMFSCC